MNPVLCRVGSAWVSTISPVSVDATDSWILASNFPFISVQLHAEFFVTIPTAENLPDPDPVT